MLMLMLMLLLLQREPFDYQPVSARLATHAATTTVVAVVSGRKASLVQGLFGLP